MNKQQKRESTNKFDCNNQEIFVGDKIIKWWGAFYWNGKTRMMYRLHTIVKKPAHKMNSGTMHDDGGGFVYNMGNAYNIWEGHEVEKITIDKFKQLGMPEEIEFFFDDNDNPVIVTGKHLFGFD